MLYGNIRATAVTAAKGVRAGDIEPKVSVLTKSWRLNHFATLLPIHISAEQSSKYKAIDKVAASTSLS